MTFRMIAIACVCLLFGMNAAASDSTIVEESKSFKLFEWGMSLGYGFINEQLPEGRYEPFLAMAHVEFQILGKKRKSDSPHYFLLFVEPQLNPVLVNGGINDWEAGGNIGVKYLIKIKEKNAMFFHAGSGPHFISIHAPEHQVNGYAFANNFGMGYQRWFRDDLRITLGYRFRHVSNLNLALPNKGLDNHFLTVGFKKDFPRRAQARRQNKKERLLLNQ